jgi:hypothetical protein
MLSLLLVAWDKRGPSLPSKLTRQQVHHARELIATGKESRAAVAELFKVNVKTLRRGASWIDVLANPESPALR